MCLRSDSLAVYSCIRVRAESREGSDTEGRGKGEEGREAGSEKWEAGHRRQKLLGLAVHGPAGSSPFPPPASLFRCFRRRLLPGVARIRDADDAVQDAEDHDGTQDEASERRLHVAALRGV